MLGTTRRTSVLTLAAALLLSTFSASAQAPARVSAQVSMRTPAGTVISNTAVFESGMGTVLSNLVSITVQAVCAPGLSPDGLSVLVPAGARASFDHVLINNGNAPQVFDLTSEGAPVNYTGSDNSLNDAQTITQVSLDAGQSALLTLQGPSRITSGDGEDWTLTASCAADPSIRATVRDHLVTRAAPVTLTKTLAGPDVTVAGADVTYTLSVTNPNLVALRDVTVTDALPGGETYVSSTPEISSRDAAGLHWNLGTLQPSEARRITLKVKIDLNVADDTLILNDATVRSSDLDGATSSQAAIRIFSTQLLLQKTVFERVADVGDLLHYTITVRNPSNVNLTQSSIDDTPDQGLTLIAGKTTLDGQPTGEPTLSKATLNFPTGPLKAGSSHTVTYVMQITPDASEQLSNTAEASAVGTNGKVVAKVLSNPASVQVTRRSQLFGGLAEIIGRVYVDRSHSGFYKQGTDTPVAGARVLLAGGQEALSDREGRYHFADLTPGMYALRLDPGSAPWKARPWPGDRGLTGSRTADVMGLTNIDFPLYPNEGSAR